MTPDSGGRCGPVLLAWSAAVPGTGAVSELSAADAIRLAELPAHRREAFLAGRRLIARLLGEVFGHAAWSLRPGNCPRCGRPHAGVVVDGVPALASVSHTRGLSVAAVAPTSVLRELGVDAEADEAAPERLDDLAVLLGCRPQQALRRWTQLEAVLKADGRGLAVEPAHVELGDPGSPQRWAAVAGDDRHYRLADVNGPPGFVVSAAWREEAASVVGDAPATR